MHVMVFAEPFPDPTSTSTYNLLPTLGPSPILPLGDGCPRRDSLARIALFPPPMGCWKKTRNLRSSRAKHDQPQPPLPSEMTTKLLRLPPPYSTTTKKPPNLFTQR
ncbi:hypothetical protein SLA2020_404340 [Shorea laevis]